MGAERDGPLLTLVLPGLEGLARRLRSLGPPSLSVLIARLEEAEEYEDFVALVREFLPEREPEILGRPTPGGQIAAFADHFEDRYFPLQDAFRGMVDSYGDLTRGIPVVPLSISYEDYHYIDEFRPGCQIMTYLLAPPSWADGGARIAVGEACAEYVPIELLRRVPEAGLSREVAGRLRDTRYKGLAYWADMLEWETGNLFLDMNAEGFWEDMPPWEREVVEDLTREWQQAEAIRKEVSDLAEWLEQDPPARLRELLNFIERS